MFVKWLPQQQQAWTIAGIHTTALSIQLPYRVYCSNVEAWIAANTWRLLKSERTLGFYRAYRLFMKKPEALGI